MITVREDLLTEGYKEFEYFKTTHPKVFIGNIKNYSGFEEKERSIKKDRDCRFFRHIPTNKIYCAQPNCYRLTGEDLTAYMNIEPAIKTHLLLLIEVKETSKISNPKENEHYYMSVTPTQILVFKHNRGDRYKIQDDYLIPLNELETKHNRVVKALKRTKKEETRIKLTAEEAALNIEKTNTFTKFYEDIRTE